MPELEERKYCGKQFRLFKELKLLKIRERKLRF
jgi:hypothetical protein